MFLSQVVPLKLQRPTYLHTNLLAFKPRELYSPVQGLGEKALMQTRNSFSICFLKLSIVQSQEKH